MRNTVAKKTNKIFDDKKSFRDNFVYPLIVAIFSFIIIFLITDYILNRDNVIYTSTSISVDDLYYSQIVVKNQGRKEVEDIKIDISSKISDFFVIKSYESDILDHYSTNVKDQFIYDCLRPQNEFVLTIITEHELPSTLAISFNGGFAKNALSDNAFIGILSLALAIVSSLLSLLFAIRRTKDKSYKEMVIAMEDLTASFDEYQNEFEKTFTKHLENGMSIENAIQLSQVNNSDANKEIY